MTAHFAPAAWAIIRITDGRLEVRGVAPTAAEARRIARNIDDDVIVAFRNTRRPEPTAEAEF